MAAQRTKTTSKAAVWKWFLHLDLDERARVLSIEDKVSVQLIQKMYDKRLSEGDGLFHAVDDDFEDGRGQQFPHSAAINKSRHLFTNKDDFCFRKLNYLFHDRIINYPEALLGPDGELEKALRLCDTREYLDTMAVATSLLNDPYHFLYLMEHASRGSFLTEPCRVEYVKKTKQWVWEPPTWFKGMGYYTLGTFICHKLEQAIWLRFFEANGLDPRVPGSIRRYTFPYSNSQALLSKTHLTQFWMGTEPRKRLQIVGRLGNVVGNALRDSAIDAAAEETKPLLPTPPLSGALRKRRKGSDATRNAMFPHTDIRLLSALVDFSMEKKAIEFLFADKSEVDDRTFIEVLYFSPLRTAGTPINYVLRRLGFIIQKAYTEQTSLDLIMCEESEKKRGPGRRGKGKGKGGSKANKNKKRMFKRKMVGPPAASSKSAAPLPVEKPPPAPHTEPAPPAPSIAAVPPPTQLEEAKGSEKLRKHRSLSPSVSTRVSHPLSAPELEERKLEPRGLPKLSLEVDASWSEVPMKRRKRKKKKSSTGPNSAPVSPRSAGRRIQHSRTGSSDGKMIAQRPRVTRSNSEDISDAKDLRSPSLAASMLAPLVEEAIEHAQTRPRPGPSRFVPGLELKREASVGLPPSHTMSDSDEPFSVRTRSSSCCPTNRGGSNPTRRSRSASARSRAPLRKKSNVLPVSNMSSGEVRKRVHLEKPNTAPRFYRPARARAKMHALRTHEEEHECARALESEIRAYVTFLKGVVRNSHARLVDRVVQRVRCFVGRMWSSAEIKVYGSIATGLHIPESDLDLVVNIPDNGGGSPVHLLAGELKGQMWVEQLQAIYTAKVPVIKLVTENLPVDITFDVRTGNPANTYAHTDLDHHHSSHTGLSTCNYILQLKKEYPALEPLVLILKQYLYCVMLNSTFTGGLASYSLVLMVASYLKFYGKTCQNLGTLLLGFFELYGKLLDYEYIAISLCEPEGFFARDETCYAVYGPVQLLIIDPLCPTNNVASSTFALYKVKQAFANGYNTLTERFASPYYPSLLSRLLPIVASNGFNPVPMAG